MQIFYMYFDMNVTLYISNEKVANKSAETFIVVFIGDDWGRIVENSPVGQGRGPGTGEGGRVLGQKRTRCIHCRAVQAHCYTMQCSN